MTCAAVPATLAVTHFALALGAGTGGLADFEVSTSAGVRGSVTRTYTAPTVAMRFRFAYSPLESLVLSLVVLAAAAWAVAGRSESGRITIPLPSADRTSTSPGLGGGRSIWA